LEEIGSTVEFPKSLRNEYCGNEPRATALDCAFYLKHEALGSKVSQCERPSLRQFPKQNLFRPDAQSQNGGLIAQLLVWRSKRLEAAWIFIRLTCRKENQKSLAKADLTLWS
jgi:hypothetical protein